VIEFKELVETSFGTKCGLELRAMNRLKLSPTMVFDDGTMEFVAQFNDEATFFKCENVSLFSPQIFDAAVYIEVVLRPQEKSSAPDYAFAHIEFKGRRPRQATYYLQPGDAEVLNALKAAHRSQRIGDGYTHNTDLG